MTRVFTILKKEEYRDILILVLLGIITRLPQLLSAYLLLDSDECIVALMSKHMSQGKGFPVFFYGQSYGFSLLETGMISLYSALFSLNDHAVKTAMLTIWIAGVIFFYKTLKSLSTKHRWLPLFISVLFVLSPVWAVWSMKARGGYLTAFLLGNVITWLLFRQEDGHTKGIWAIIGVLVVVIFYSQPLWLPGLLPIIAWRFWQIRKRSLSVAFCAGILPAWIMMQVARHYVVDYWKPSVFNISPAALKQAGELPGLLFDHFHAYYYLTDVFCAPLICNIFSVLSITALVLFIIAAAWKLLLLRKHTGLIAVVLFSVLCTLGYAIFLDSHAPRYLLPLSGFLYFGIFLLLQQVQRAAILKCTFPVLFITGAVAMYSFCKYHFNPTTKTQMLSCIDYLEQQHVRYVFSNDGLLEWQLMYYSDEHLMCRESSKQDRVPEYVQEVDHAFIYDRAHTAVVDFYGDLEDMEPERAIKKGDKFAIVLQPDAGLLRRMEFQL